MSSHACRAAIRLALAAAAACSLPVSGPAVAAEPGAQAGTIEQVTVTARRREESLQDVPVAITALTADQLLEQNVRTLEDITAYAPNIKVNAGRATTSTINAYIRGVGQNDPLWGFEPGVGIYLDDVYIARPQGALLDVYDVRAHRSAARPARHAVRQEHDRGRDQVRDPRHRHGGSGVQRHGDRRQLRPARHQGRRLHAGRGGSRLSRRSGRIPARATATASSSTTAPRAHSTGSGRTSRTRTCWPRAPTPRSCGARARSCACWPTRSRTTPTPPAGSA